MAEKVTIRTVKQYFSEFIAKPLEENGMDWFRHNTETMRNNILENFRKEIFGQIIFKLGPEAKTMTRDDLANLDGIQNILQQSFRKFRRLCMICGEHGLHFLQINDLAETLKEEDDAEQIPDHRSAEDPEAVSAVPTEAGVI